jgi:hypothetical protein
MTPRYALWCRLTPLSLQRSHCPQRLLLWLWAFPKRKKDPKKRIKSTAKGGGRYATCPFCCKRPFLLLLPMDADVSNLYREVDWIATFLRSGPSLSPILFYFFLFHTTWAEVALFERLGDELERNAEEGTIWNECGSEQPTSRKCDRNKMQEAKEGVR